MRLSKKAIKTMMKSNLQTADSPTHKRKLHLFHDVLEYIFILIISLSSIFAILFSFLDRIMMFF